VIVFGFAVVIAGLSADDPLITGCGLVLFLIGLGLFVWRQLRRGTDVSDAQASAGVVKLQAPASLIAVIVGLLLVLIGRGALSWGDNDEPDIAALEATITSETRPEPVAAPTTTTTRATTTTTTQPSPAAPETEPMPVLPRTGGETLIPLSLAMLAGGRWILRA